MVISRVFDGNGEEPWPKHINSATSIKYEERNSGNRSSKNSVPLFDDSLIDMITLLFTGNVLFYRFSSVNHPLECQCLPSPALRNFQRLNFLHWNIFERNVFQRGKNRFFLLMLLLSHWHIFITMVLYSHERTRLKWCSRFTTDFSFHLLHTLKIANK